jgi:hypothetical protein
MVCCPKVRKYQEAFVERKPNQHQYSFPYFVVGILKYCIKSVVTECLVYGLLNQVCAVATALFTFGARCGMLFFCLDEKDVHFMGQHLPFHAINAS